MLCELYRAVVSIDQLVASPDVDIPAPLTGSFDSSFTLTPISGICLKTFCESSHMRPLMHLRLGKRSRRQSLTVSLGQAMLKSTYSSSTFLAVTGSLRSKASSTRPLQNKTTLALFGRPPRVSILSDPHINVVLLTLGHASCMVHDNVCLGIDASTRPFEGMQVHAAQCELQMPALISACSQNLYNQHSLGRGTESTPV